MPRVPEVDIAEWLGQLGLAQYADAFRSNDIDASVLTNLTAEDLRDVGVASVGHRRRILTETAALARPATSAAQEFASDPPAAGEIAERRVLTVMFCDLVGSMELSALCDPEDFREFISQFRHEVEGTIKAFGGMVSQFLGDGIMASFGFPVASGHDAERAVAAGLALVDTVARIPPIEGRKPQVRVGIATGLSVVGTFDQGLSINDESAIGETPSLAARLQTAAEPGRVVIADATRHLVGEIFDCTDLGLVQVKGIAEPVRLWSVRGRSSAASRYDALRATRRSGAFVGRHKELAEVKRLFESMRASTGRTLVINGDTGIGKSRFVRHAFSLVGVERPVTLQCSPYGIGVPFHPLRNHVRQAAGLVASETAESAVARLSAWLPGAVDSPPEHAAEVMAAQMDLIPLDSGHLADLGPITLRARGIVLLHEIILRAGREFGALILEDIQWIDPSTVQVLTGLLPHLRAEGILTVATAQAGPLADWLVKIGAESLRLRRLDPAALDELVRDLAKDRALDPKITEALIVRSDGVPLFAEELVRGFLDAEYEESDSDPLALVPVSLSESLLARLDKLVHGRRIASIAAAIGREIPVSILPAVCDLPEGVVHAGIGELLSADVIIPAETRFGEAIRFRHNLMREAAYELLLRRQRTVLHARIADTLTERFPDIAAAVPHVVAIQRAAAGQNVEAGHAWERAGQEASRRSAYLEAAGFFQNSIDLILRDEPGADRDERELSLRLSLAAALISASGHHSKRVEEEIERVVALGRELGSSEKLVPAIHLNWVKLLTGNQAKASRDFAYQVLEATASGPAADRLIALRMCATSNLFCGDLRKALEHYRDFMRLFDPERHADHMRIGHTDHTAIVMMGLAETFTLMGNRAEAETWRVRCIEYARASSRVHDRCHTLTFAGCLHPYLLGDDAEVERHARELAELLRATPLPAWAGFPNLFLGAVAVRRGNPREGIETARRGVDSLKAQRIYHNFWPLVHAELCLACEEWAEAQEMLDDANRMMAHGDVRFRSELLRLEAALAARCNGDRKHALLRLDEAAKLAKTQGAGLFADRITTDLERSANSVK